MARAPKQARMGAAGEPASYDSTPAKAVAGRGQQKQDPTKGRLDQGITLEYPPNTLANPLGELIHPEPRGLHPLGALACTHVSQAEGDPSSVMSIRM
jgi:hypothetical protein